MVCVVNLLTLIVLPQANGLGGAERVYSTFIDCGIKTCRNEGAMALYKGLKANTIRCIPGAAIQFYAYDTLKSILGC